MYTLRTSTSSDADFAYETLKTTMREFAIQTWGNWLDKESRLAAVNDTKEGRIQIICVGNANAGTLQYQIANNSILVKQLYLLPAFQKKGIGTEIIRDLKRKSHELRVPIKLSVLQVNPAKAFYIKNGFSIEDETKERAYMRYDS